MHESKIQRMALIHLLGTTIPSLGVTICCMLLTFFGFYTSSPPTTNPSEPTIMTGEPTENINIMTTIEPASSTVQWNIDLLLTVFISSLCLFAIVQSIQLFRYCAAAIRAKEDSGAFDIEDFMSPPVRLFNSGKLWRLNIAQVVFLAIWISCLALFLLSLHQISVFEIFQLKGLVWLILFHSICYEVAFFSLLWNLFRMYLIEIL